MIAAESKEHVSLHHDPERRNDVYGHVRPVRAPEHLLGHAESPIPDPWQDVPVSTCAAV